MSLDSVEIQKKFWKRIGRAKAGSNDGYYKRYEKFKRRRNFRCIKVIVPKIEKR